MAACQTMPGLSPNRRGMVGQWLALAGAAIAIAVIVALIVTWPGHNGSEGSTSANPAVKQAGSPPAHHATAIRP